MKRAINDGHTQMKIRLTNPGTSAPPTPRCSQGIERLAGGKRRSDEADGVSHGGYAEDEQGPGGAKEAMKALFPMFVKLEGRSCLVVGAGKTGEAKIASLLSCGARVHVVALAGTERVEAWHRERALQWEARAFHPSDLDGAFLVVAATNSSETNQNIFHEARQRQIPCNAVDDPAHCDFFYPAVVRRGPLQIAISTAGFSPALAQRLRRQLEQQFAPEYGAWIEELGRYRRQLFAQDLRPPERRRLLHLAASHDPGSMK